MTESHPHRLISNNGRDRRNLWSPVARSTARVGVETHLIVSKWGAQTLAEETSYSLDRVRQLATCATRPRTKGRRFRVAHFSHRAWWWRRASVRTLAAIASGQGDNLIHRAADVILKERRKLVLLVRETPFNENPSGEYAETSADGRGDSATVPAFYNHPQSLEAMVDHVVMRTLDQFGIHTDLAERWGGEVQVPRGRKNLRSHSDPGVLKPGPVAGKKSAADADQERYHGHPCGGYKVGGMVIQHKIARRGNDYAD